MGEVLNKLDSFLIERFQWFAHRFQKLTGKTNFWLASMFYKLAFLCITLFIALSTIFVYNHMHSLSSVVTLAPSGIICIFIIGNSIKNSVKRCEKKEEEFFSAAKETMNIERIQFSGLRILVLFFGLAGVIPLLWFYSKHSDKSFIFIVLYFIFLITAIYFSACTPLPPGKSKVKKWLESWKIKRKLALKAN